MAEKKSKKTAAAADAPDANLEAAMAQITKTFGEGSIMKLGTAQAQSSIEAIPTGSLSLDLARSASAACLRAASWKSMARNPLAKPP